MSETCIHPAADQIAAIRDLAIDGPVTMLNLLRFNPDGGAEAYARYGAAAAPFLEMSGDPEGDGRQGVNRMAKIAYHWHCPRLGIHHNLGVHQ